MPQILFHQPAPYPLVIQRLRFFILLAIITYAGWFDLAIAGITSILPNQLLLSPAFGWSYLFQPITAALTIPYPGFGLSMIFDLLLINFLLSPICTFVLSFLSEKGFFKLFFGQIIIGTGVFLGLASAIATATPPCSLFGGLSLSFIIFWAMLHRKGQSTLLLAFPISRAWVVVLSTFAALYSPVSGKEWAHIGAIFCMSLASYFWAVTRWRLRSNVDGLEKFENWLDCTYRSCFRLIEWYILGPFRRKLH